MMDINNLNEKTVLSYLPVEFKLSFKNGSAYIVRNYLNNNSLFALVDIDTFLNKGWRDPTTINKTTIAHWLMLGDRINDMSLDDYLDSQMGWTGQYVTESDIAALL